MQDKKKITVSEGLDREGEDKIDDLDKIRKIILRDLVLIGQRAYPSMLEGIYPEDALFDRIMEALLTCLPSIEICDDDLYLLCTTVHFIASQIEAGCALNNLSFDSPSESQDPKHARSLMREYKGSEETDPDVECLRQILLKSLQGAAWFALRAQNLGADLSDYRDGFIVGLASVADTTLGMGGLLSRLMESGQLNVACATALNQQQAVVFGQVKPVSVRLFSEIPSGLIVAGSDWNALKEVLSAAVDQRISVYTAGELGAAHGFSLLGDNTQLVGHVDAEAFMENYIQEKPCLVRTAFTPVSLKGFPEVKSFCTPMISQRENSRPEDISVGGSAESLWTCAKRSPDLTGKSIATYEAGWGYNSLIETLPAVLAGLHDGTIQTIAVAAIPETSTSLSEVANRLGNYYDEKTWMMICGSPLPLFSGKPVIEDRPNPVYVGTAGSILDVVSWIHALAGEMHCRIDQVPYRILFPAFSEEYIGLMIGLMSLGLNGFDLHPDWTQLFSPKAQQLLANQFNMHIRLQ